MLVEDIYEKQLTKQTTYRDLQRFSMHKTIFNV